MASSLVIKKTNKKGFSLVEVLIATMVLIMGVGAVIALMSSGIKTSLSAKNQVIASGIAQEIVEMVRFMKENNPTTFNSVDNKCFSRNGFYNSGKNVGPTPKCPCPDPTILNDTCASSGASAVFPLGVLGSENNTPLYIDNGTIECDPTHAGFYTNASECSNGYPRTKTKFFREYYIENDTVNKQVVVTAYVTWNGTGFPIGGDTATNCNLGNSCVSIESILPD